MENSNHTNNPCLVTLPEMLPEALFFAELCNSVEDGYNPLAYFGTADRELICIMGKSLQPLRIFRTAFPEGKAYESLTVKHPAFHILERELFEEWEILPQGHPWLKPVRYPCGSKHNLPDYPFFNSESTALHEVAVGPVHAGVIEPGHFRFICQGETVEHLEIQLGYQHRNVCALLAEGDLRDKISLAEAITGDTAIGHSLAYCLGVEALCNADISSSVKAVRQIALELERIAMHLADLSALSGDIAYLSGLNFFAALRTTIINSSLALCGSRFGKRWLTPGGINYGISVEQNKTLRQTLLEAGKQIDNCARAMFADAGVLNRFDSTGTLGVNAVKDLNMSGITAKASGYAIDARKDYPWGGNAGFEPLTQDSGDVYARAYLRYREIMQSLEMIQFMLSTLPEVKPSESISLAEPQPDKLVVSIVEGWRGRIVHVIKTDSLGKTQLYKVIDPSLHNWFGLALAVREQGISDFPLCNKSFDLSYCGNDL